ncbi:MAG TPA: hypothetical protein VJR89_08460 [Polyangiales bacterium]|nr:hypothetical protein [Polyangiales bacterium]
MEIASIVPEHVIARVLRWFEHPRLAARLALIAVLLSSTCLFTGFYLDDYIGRYVYSDLPGAKHLYQLLAGGYGIATGNPAENLWQVEHGWAPWWIYDRLLIRLFRPFGELSHQLDAWLWPSSAALQHLHSLLWLALLVWATTRMYRVAHGPLVGGIAATLFAFDHTHGFVVGYICNRHALITALLGILALAQYLRSRAEPSIVRSAVAVLLYALAMVSGESTIAIGGYVFAHVLFVETGSWWRRALVFAPYALITVGFRALYSLAGYGASGSGMYVDPVRQPLSFLGAFLERTPVLILGQFLFPPAEAYVAASPFWARVILATAFLMVVVLVCTLLPLLRNNRLARFWAAGALLSLIPAASTYPHNRQLLFTSFGAMALIAQLFQLHILELGNRAHTLLLKLSREFGGGLMFAHLVISPLAMPVSTLGVLLANALHHAPESIGDEVAGRDVVFVTAPDYFAVKLVQLDRRIAQKPLPRRIRALAFGYETVTVHRTDARTLELDYEGGILSFGFLELYRDRHIPMRVGERIELQGLSIEVLATTPDGRVEKARFAFDTDLDAPSFLFYNWRDGGFVPFKPPPVGEHIVMPRASLALGLS